MIPIRKKRYMIAACIQEALTSGFVDQYVSHLSEDEQAEMKQHLYGTAARYRVAVNHKGQSIYGREQAVLRPYQQRKEQQQYALIIGQD